MSRLKKMSMDINSFESTINQTGQKGRQILKSLEDFKFTLEQTARLLKNNQQMSQGMIQKRKSIDEISSKLYQIVFDLENMDISNAFMTQNQPVMEELPNKSPDGNKDNKIPDSSNGQQPVAPLPNGNQNPMPPNTQNQPTPTAPPTPPVQPSGQPKADTNESEDSE